MKDPRYGGQGEAMRFDDPADDIGRNPSTAPAIGEVIAARIGRRDVVRGLLATGAIAAAGGLMGPGSGLAPGLRAALANDASTLGFRELTRTADATHHVAEGYDAKVLIRWGDPVLADAPTFDAGNLAAAAQARQFGYNCDFVGFVSLPEGSRASDRGLLCVNHEYTNTDFMWSGIDRANIMEKATREMVAVELAAHGISVIEVTKRPEGWAVVPDSRYNRRISAQTEIEISGPAAGHARFATASDPTGRKVLGTLSNCAGGMTPWGTMLSGEENFDLYFSGSAAGTAEADNHRRYGIRGRPVYRWWATFEPRFDVARAPNEPNRFGWVVELDPFAPEKPAVKRTALGRAKHENASCAVNHDGRVVVYSGDDEAFEYVYKFVTAGRFNPNDRAANRDLLDQGTLFVARFESDGRVRWLPLVFGHGPLTAANGFASQADVLIETRRAADLLGATPMDRPEDVEPNPVTGTVYVLLTSNADRVEGGEGEPRRRVNAANPRAKNVFGHVLAMMPPKVGAGFDHAASEFAWTIPIFCGSSDPASGASYALGTSAHGAFAAPDNCTFDSKGRLWITTDQGNSWPKLSGAADGVFAMDVAGVAAYRARRFFTTPVGAEMCGPCFTPDDRTLFVAVQHPATDGVAGSNFDTPATRWPDFQAGVPPRPSIVVITKRDGGVIGS